MTLTFPRLAALSTRAYARLSLRAGPRRRLRGYVAVVVVDARERDHRQIVMVLAVVAWVVALLVALYLAASAAMDQWAYGAGGGEDAAREAEVGRRGEIAAVALFAVAGGGPVVLAALAAAFRFQKTAIAALLLAVLVLPVTCYLAALTVDDDTPTPPPPPTRHCVEYSGGDASCPGG